MGSCFSDELEPYFRNSGFDVLSNPFGTLFHPLALSSVIKSSLGENEALDVFKRSDLFFSWDASSKIVGMKEEALKANLLTQRRSTREKIVEAQTIIVTFGSAFGYFNKALGKIVANCHKAPNHLFEKQLSSVDEMLADWIETIDQIRAVNPTIQFLFTVSPVRHTKDGLVENNRSKARLIELAHRICEETGAHYFPSYEIVMDQLRDYRFFAKDLVHPNALAVDYVWEQFSQVAFTEETLKIIKKVNEYVKMTQHVFLHPDSEEAKKYKESMDKLRLEIERFSGLVRF